MLHDPALYEFTIDIDIDIDTKNDTNRPKLANKIHKKLGPDQLSLPSLRGR